MIASTTQANIHDQFADTPWTQNGSMSLESVSVIISYLHFLTQLNTTLYEKFKTVQLKPNESLWQHAQEFLSTSSQSSEQAIRAAHVAPLEIPPTSHRPSRSKTRSNTRSPQRSPQRKTSFSRYNQSYRSKSRDPSPNTSNFSSQYCKFCKRNGHTLSNCRTVGRYTYCAYHDSRSHSTKNCTTLRRKNFRGRSPPNTPM